MESFKDVFLETTSNTFKVYHGGMEWSGDPTIGRGKKGKYEHGLGIYFTTRYNTAKKYAKGNRIVILADIDKNYKDLKDVKIDIKDIVTFLHTNNIKNRGRSIKDLLKYSYDRGITQIPADTFNNFLIENESLTGESGKLVTAFLLSKGVQGTQYSRDYSEDWFVVFDVSIIKKWIKINPKIPFRYDLPKIKTQ